VRPDLRACGLCSTIVEYRIDRNFLAFERAVAVTIVPATIERE